MRTPAWITLVGVALLGLLGSVYVPYGEPPEGGVLRSEYGATPLSGLLQLRLYF